MECPSPYLLIVKEPQKNANNNGRNFSGIFVLTIHDDNVHNNIMYVDVPLVAMGAILCRKVYTLQIHQILKFTYTIVHFEAVNTLVMLRLWGAHIKNQICTVYCDNMGVINVYTNHKIQDPFLVACMGSVWLICAVITIKLQHIKGEMNVYADILSRWHAYCHSNSSNVAILKQCNSFHPH